MELHVAEVIILFDIGKQHVRFMVYQF